MMDNKTFLKFREIVYENSGITLSDSKEAMVSSRIAKRMRLLGIEDHKQYLQFLLGDATGGEITRFLDVISTNVTSFFREEEHFEVLAELLSRWISKGKNKIRIWSAASSTGEEPYSIAMTMLFAANKKYVDMRILGTDISTKVLEKAKAGAYSASAVEDIPDNFKKIFFTVKKENFKNVYAARDILKNLIIFRRLNLSKPPFPMSGKLDVVFCRNVMIYFDNDVRSRLVSEIYRLLNPGGYLFTGHAESLTTLKTDFKCLRPSIYQKLFI